MSLVIAFIEAYALIVKILEKQVVQEAEDITQDETSL